MRGMQLVAAVVALGLLLPSGEKVGMRGGYLRKSYYEAGSDFALSLN
jgi:hypothetical protein